MCVEKTKIVVLGCRFCVDGSMDSILKERLDFAVALADSLGCCFGGFVLSGGQWVIRGKLQVSTEAELMWAYLHTQHKVSLSRVRSETQSRTTVESARNLFGSREELQLCDFIVVTSWSHRRRARKIFSKIFGKSIIVRSPSFEWREWQNLLLSPVAWVVSHFELWRFSFSRR